MANSVNGRLRARPVQRFGWVPDLPDARDFLYSAPEAVLTTLPTKVDLRRKMPPIYDQGQLGSCTANAIAAAFEFDQTNQGGKDFMPSRLFIYYNERAIEGTVDSDSGAMIRDGIKSVAKVGVCDEPRRVKCRCRRAASNSSVGMPSSPLATTTVSSASSSGTPGARSGG